MASEDWYRYENWNAETESHFYSKLKRARSQRDQYLVIQALTLTENHPEVSLRLVEEYFESKTGDFEDVRALLTKAQAYLALSDIENAIDSYKSILECERKFPSHQTTAYVDYPYLVATLEIESEYENAILVLAGGLDSLTFPLDYFKWRASKALIEQDGQEARRALESAEVKKSGFRFHQNLGLVGKEHEKTIKRLCTFST